jgi:hypothetical protein
MGELWAETQLPPSHCALVVQKAMHTWVYPSQKSPALQSASELQAENRGSAPAPTMEHVVAPVLVSPIVHR